MSDHDPGREASAELHGTGDWIGTAPWEVETWFDNGAGVAFIDITFDLGGFEATFTVSLDKAERFIRDIRDAVVEGKQQELEWATDTDGDEAATGESDA